MGGRSATRPRIELWLISTNQGEVGKTFHFPLRGRVAHRPPNTVEILTIFNRKFTAQDNFDFLTRYIGSVLISYICGWSVCHTTTEKLLGRLPTKESKPSVDYPENNNLSV
jgi:hypothetical protein